VWRCGITAADWRPSSQRKRILDDKEDEPELHIVPDAVEDSLSLRRTGCAAGLRRDVAITQAQSQSAGSLARLEIDQETDCVLAPQSAKQWREMPNIVQTIRCAEGLTR
jgi:hypothetical protein